VSRINADSATQNGGDVARVHFEAARDRLASTKNLAAEIMDFPDWYNWRYTHTDVKYAAMQIGEAILEVLRDYAWSRAVAFITGEIKGYKPYKVLGEITKALEEGGFDFRTSTPQREVNAALINLNVEKWQHMYAVSDKDEWLSLARSSIDADKQVAITEPEPEDIPFE
jgi:hypothetical protein